MIVYEFLAFDWRWQWRDRLIHFRHSFGNSMNKIFNFNTTTHQFISNFQRKISDLFLWRKIFARKKTRIESRCCHNKRCVDQFSHLIAMQLTAFYHIFFTLCPSNHWMSWHQMCTSIIEYFYYTAFWSINSIYFWFCWHQPQILSFFYSVEVFSSSACCLVQLLFRLIWQLFIDFVSLRWIDSWNCVVPIGNRWISVWAVAE